MYKLSLNGLKSFALSGNMKVRKPFLLALLFSLSILTAKESISLKVKSEIEAYGSPSQGFQLKGLKLDPAWGLVAYGEYTYDLNSYPVYGKVYTQVYGPNTALVEEIKHHDSPIPASSGLQII